MNTNCQISYYQNIIIHDQQDALIEQLVDTQPIHHFPNEKIDGSYFELIYSNHRFCYTVNEFKSHQLFRKYQYSLKGNLVWEIKYPSPPQKYIIKHIYDYTFHHKHLKEKRYYDRSQLLKKEEYRPHNLLKKISYYRDDVVYYTENFDEQGALQGSRYFKLNGLVVK